MGLFPLKDFANGLVDFKDHVGREVLFFALLLIDGPIRRFVVVGSRRF